MSSSQGLPRSASAPSRSGSRTDASGLPDQPRLLWVSTLPFYPDGGGGAELTHRYLFEKLLRRGWRIEAVCMAGTRSGAARALRGAAGPAARALRQIAGRVVAPRGPAPKFAVDEDLGYPSWRARRGRRHLRCWAAHLLFHACRTMGLPALARAFHGCARSRIVACVRDVEPLRACFDERLDRFQPDLVLGHYGCTPFLKRARDRGFPSFYFVHGVGDQRFGRRDPQPEGIDVIVNSPWTATASPRAQGKQVGVVIPFVEPAEYRAPRRERRYITFINPVPEKGLATVLEVARRLPHERFLFVKGGWFYHDSRLVTRFRMRGIRRLPNVEVWEYQEDMRRVYAVTDILLAASHRESFCRVILEAHINGIPVVARNTTAIPYTLGRGGILVDSAEGARGFVAALRRLREDEGLYAELSRLALENSRRSEFASEQQVENFIQFVDDRLGREGRRAVR